jgi:hypothetical protein
MIEDARKRLTPDIAFLMNHFRGAWTSQRECRQFSHWRTKFRQ